MIQWSRQKSKVPWILGAEILLLGLVAVSLIPQPKSEPILRTIQHNACSLEGQLAFLGESGVRYQPVAEHRDGTNVQIEYAKANYYIVDGQYYVDMGDGPVPIPTPEEELPVVQEMFQRASVLPSYDVSELTFRSSYATLLPDLETGELVWCQAEEYEREGTEWILRMYFRSDELYAIQCKEDRRYIYYVSSFSGQPSETIELPASAQTV